MQDPTLAFQTPEAQLQQLIAHMQQQQQHPLIIEPRAKKIARHKFTPEEDDVLRNLVWQFGKSDWAAIARRLENRTPRQCRERWKHYLSPDVSTSNWSEAEDQLLTAKVRELGTRWAAIAQHFPNRTDIGVKNRYISMTGRRSKESTGGAVAGVGIMGLGIGGADDHISYQHH
jgi:hypothetical protein